MWQNVLFTIYSCLGCKLRIDELSTVQPEKALKGGASTDHSFYVALRFMYCEDWDKPRLSTYSLAILRISDNESKLAPLQLAYFDLYSQTPLMKAGKTFNYVKLLNNL